MPEPDLIDRLRLARTEGVGPVTFRRMLARFGNAARALEALPRLAKAGGRAEPPVIPARETAERELEDIKKLGARMVMPGDPDYPPLLALLDDAPPVLLVLGDVRCLAGRSVALVGGRNASANGQRIAEDLGAGLGEAGIAVVSGMARGIDGAAHRGALSAGCTVAVVAGGLDVPYPPEHADLQRQIAASGAVVTEAALGTVPLARHFPRRNRIIAGLTLGVVVVEAAPRSGSLITARLAAEAGREVMAVPGSPLDPRSRGGNDLLRQGATLVETAEDVLANLPERPIPGATPLFAAAAAPDSGAGMSEPIPSSLAACDSAWELTEARTQVLELLGPSPTAVDAVVRRCQLPATAVMAVLLELELAGRIETLPGGRVAVLTDPPV